MNAALLGGYGLPERSAFTSRLRLAELLQTAAGGTPRGVSRLVRQHSYNWYTNNPIAQFEGYYASIFYSHFAALGLDIRLEDTTNHGRIDMTVLFSGQVFIFNPGCG